MNFLNKCMVFGLGLVVALLYINCGGGFNSLDEYNDPKINVVMMDGNQEVLSKKSNFTVKNGKVIIDGDIVLGSSDEIRPGDTYKVSVNLPSPSTSAENKGFQAAKLRANIFPKGEIFYKIGDSYNLVERLKILDFIAQFNNVMINENVNLQMIPRTSQKAYLEIKDNNMGCSSGLGYSDTVMYLNIGKECLRLKTFFHEMMHRLGYMHEHQRPDRDEYIVVDDSSFVKLETKGGRTEHPYFKYSANTQFDHLSDYDYFSITHYGNGLNEDSGTLMLSRKEEHPVHGFDVGGATFSQMDLASLRRFYGSFSNGEKPDIKERVSYPQITIDNVISTGSNLERQLTFTLDNLKFQDFSTAIIFINYVDQYGNRLNNISRVYPVQNMNDFKMNGNKGSIDFELFEDHKLDILFELIFVHSEYNYIQSKSSFRFSANSEQPKSEVDNTKTSGNDHPSCQSSDSDPDGDGYGWENEKTCKVVEDLSNKETQPGGEKKQPESRIEEGDMLIWNNQLNDLFFLSLNTFCEVSISNENSIKDLAVKKDKFVSTDRFADLVSYVSESSYSKRRKCTGAEETKILSDLGTSDLEPEGENQGQLNPDSKKSTQTGTSHPPCQNKGSDPDGDGYGWENNSTCIVADTGSEDTSSSSSTSEHPLCERNDSDSDGDGYGWENGASCIVPQN